MYPILSLLYWPVYLGLSALRGVTNPAYRTRIMERFGWYGTKKLALEARSAQECRLWIHAVSAGEVLGAIPLIHKLLQEQALKEDKTFYRIILTTSTLSGSRCVERAFPDATRYEPESPVWHVYAPFDLGDGVARFLKVFDPDQLILFETELWPNFLVQMRSRNRPVWIVNGRLSDRSFPRYFHTRWLWANWLQSVQVLAQSEIDACRFKAIGVAPERLQVVGNLKFDQVLAAPLSHLKEKGRLLRETLLGRAPQVWVTASTHPGEERLLWQVFEALKVRHGGLVWVLIPRHPERADAILDDLSKEWERAGFNRPMICRRRSVAGEMEEGIPDLYLVDVMGEMMDWYAAADVAFVGGSWSRVGGHNLLEPAALGLPIATGPCLSNFRSISESLLKARGLRITSTPGDLIQFVEDVCASPSFGTEMGQRAASVLRAHQGGMEKTWRAVLQDTSKECQGREDARERVWSD